MGRVSDNRIKFNRPNLKAFERRVDRGEFTKESYLYDLESHLAIRVRPNQSYSESTFCLYGRIRARGEQSSKMYKRQIMKVSEARNSEATISDLRHRVDSLFIEIQEGRDPQLLAQQKVADEIEDQKLIKDVALNSCEQIEEDFERREKVVKLSSDILNSNVEPVLRKIKAAQYGLDLHEIKQVLTALYQTGLIDKDARKSYKLKRFNSEEK